MPLLPGARSRGAAAVRARGARGRRRGDRRRGRRCRRGPGDPPCRPVRAAARPDRDGRQHAGGAGRSHGDRPSRGSAGVWPDRRDARGDRLRRGARRAGDRARAVRRAVHRRGRPRRSARAVPPLLVPLGVDRDAGHADGPGTRARRAPARRGPALPSRPAALTGAADARHHRRRTRPRARRRRRPRGPRLRRRASAGRRGARTPPLLAPRHRVRRLRGGAGLAGGRSPDRAVSCRSARTRLCTRRWGPARSRWRWRSSSARCSRSPTAGGSSDERAVARARDVFLPRRRGSGDRGRVTRDRPGRAGRARRRVGLGQVDAAPRRQRARPALPRRRFRRPRHGRRHGHARARPGSARGSPSARCSRTPRRRS